MFSNKLERKAATGDILERQETKETPLRYCFCTLTFDKHIVVHQTSEMVGQVVIMSACHAHSVRSEQFGSDLDPP